MLTRAILRIPRIVSSLVLILLGHFVLPLMVRAGQGSHFLLAQADKAGKSGVVSSRSYVLDGIIVGVLMAGALYAICKGQKS